LQVTHIVVRSACAWVRTKCQVQLTHRAGFSHTPSIGSLTSSYPAQAHNSKMLRLPRFCPADYPTHVVQRGNNRQVCFTCDDDMAAYAHNLHEGANKYGIAVHAWVFMTNHVHLMMTPSTDQGISQLMRHMGRHCVQPFNLSVRPIRYAECHLHSRRPERAYRTHAFVWKILHGCSPRPCTRRASCRGKYLVPGLFQYEER